MMESTTLTITSILDIIEDSVTLNPFSGVQSFGLLPPEEEKGEGFLRLALHLGGGHFTKLLRGP